MKARFIDGVTAFELEGQEPEVNEVKRYGVTFRVGDRVKIDYLSSRIRRDKGRLGVIIRFVVDDLFNPIAADLKMDDSKRVKCFDTCDLVKVGAK